MDSPDENTESESQTTPVLPFQALNSLPFNRREIDRWHNELLSVVDYQPVTMELFERPPVIELEDADDVRTINRLRAHFTQQQSQKKNYKENAFKATKDLAHHLKERLCVADMYSSQNRNIMREIEQLKMEYSDLNNTVQMLDKENSALRTRLACYGANDEIDRQRGNEIRKQAKMKQTVIEQQRNMLRQVEQVLDNSRPESGQVQSLRKKFDQDIVKPKRNPRTHARNLSPTFSSGLSNTNFPSLLSHRRSQSVPRRF